jgi:hypothetical protein
LEERISRWPPDWGDDLHFIIYGDFRPPEEPLHFSDLGITVEAEKVTKSLVTTAKCVLKARITVKEKSVAGIVDAAKRIETLLGLWAVVDWGNCGCGWWCHVTHGTPSGTSFAFNQEEIEKAVERMRHLDPKVSQKVRAALYWIREPRQMVMEGYRGDTLRIYAGYWNAFECLVEAVCLLRPQPKATKKEKQDLIDQYLANRRLKSCDDDTTESYTDDDTTESYTLVVDHRFVGRASDLSVADITKCYRFVDPGFAAKASHALRICFPERAERYIDECFKVKPKEDRLYDIRNAINHGDINADDLRELIRVEDKHSRLWMIVFGMLGLLIPIKRPLDSEAG